MLLLCLEPTACQPCFRPFHPTFSPPCGLFLLTHSLAGVFSCCEQVSLSWQPLKSVALCVCAPYSGSHSSNDFFSFFSLYANVRTMHPILQNPYSSIFFLLCYQYSGTLRPGADSRSQGCRGNNWAPSPWWRIWTGRLHQVWPHDLCHRPTDKSSCVETGAAQVRMDYVTKKATVASIEKHVSQSRARMFGHTARPWWNSLFGFREVPRCC